MQSGALVMIKQKSGKIINISSIVAKTGSIFSGMNYSASKAGVSSLTINFAKALAPYGINVNGIVLRTVTSVTSAAFAISLCVFFSRLSKHAR